MESISDLILNIFKTFDAIAATGTKAKVAELMTHLVKHPKRYVAEDVFYYALDWRVTFGVKPPDISTLVATKSQYIFSPNEAHTEFVALADDLNARKITGNAARGAVNDFLTSCNDLQKRWYYAVFDKKLRMGVDTLIYEYFPGLVEIFDVPKGAALVKQKTQCILPNVKKRLTYPLMSEPKYDGYAILTEIDLVARTARTLTSGGTELPAMQGYANAILKQVLKKKVPSILTSRFYIDGEITSTYGERAEDLQWQSSWGKAGALVQAGSKTGDPLNKIMRTMIAEDLTYNVYDIFPTTAMKNRVDIFPPFRHETIDYLFPADAVPGVEVTPQVPCKSWEEAQIQHKKWVKLGYEGSIYRMRDTPIWSAGNRWRHNYVKQKDYQRVDGVILGVEEGSGQYKGMAGAFICWMPSRKAKTKSTVLGAAARDWVWKHRHEILGYHVEITIDASVTGNAQASRNPVARFRDDQMAEGGKTLEAMYVAAKIPIPANIPQMPFQKFFRQLAMLAIA